MEDYIKKNQTTIDGWVKAGWRWGQPLDHKTYQAALKGDYKIFLTPTQPVPTNWLGQLSGKKVLGLAAGGGQQGPILTALGADVTIFDFSQAQLDTEQSVAQREGYTIQTIQGDMSQPLPFEDDQFDLIFHPVANVYIEDVLPLWREAYRILKPQGLLLAGLDNGLNYIVSDDEKNIVNDLPFNPLKNQKQLEKSLAENAGIQFSHGIQEQIGDQLKVGFRLLDVYDDTNGTGYLHEHHIPSFWATLSQK